MEELLRAAETAQEPVIVVTGTEEALRRLAFDRLLAQASAGGFTAVRVSAREAAAAAAIRQACEPTLFGGLTWLFVTDTEQAADDVLDSLKQVIEAADPDLRMALSHAGTPRGRGVITAAQKAGARVLEARPVAANALAVVLSAHARQRGCVLNGDAAAVLVDTIGQDLAALLGAVQQLASDAPGAMIDVELVRSTLTAAGTGNQFEIADLVWHRQTGEALAAFRQLAERNGASSAAVTVVAALSYSLRTLARYATERPSGTPWQVASALGVPAWKVDVLAAQSRGWRPAQLAGAALALADADADAKGGLGDAGALDPEQKLFAVERLIRELGAP